VWSTSGSYVNVYCRYWIVWLILWDHCLFVCVPPSQFFRFLCSSCQMKRQWAISSYRTSVIGQTSGSEGCKSRPGLWGLVDTVLFLITSPERWTHSLRRVFPAALRASARCGGCHRRRNRLVRFGVARAFEILNQCCNIGESALACRTSAHLRVGV
jgi:hypothetical protein